MDLDPFRSQDNFLESIKFGSFESFTSFKEFDDVIKIDSDSEQLSEEDQFVVIQDDDHVTEDFPVFQCEEEEDDLVGNNSGAEVQQQTLKIIRSKNSYIITTSDNAMLIEEEEDDSSSSSSTSGGKFFEKNGFQELKLSDEEKRLLTKEGITLPTHYPLTKFEERELKRIRRKIRNKISAQDSRKRKKEFLDKLQQRVSEVEEEKSLLSKKVRTLESANTKLSQQVKRLQLALTQQKKPNPTAATTTSTTTLLVLILSLALVVLPTTFNSTAKKNKMMDVSMADFNNSQDDGVATGFARSRTMLPPSSPQSSPPTSFHQKRGRYDEIDSSLLSNAEDDEIISNMIMMSSLRRRKRLLLSQQQQNTFQNDHIFDNVVKLVEDKIYD